MNRLVELAYTEDIRKAPDSETVCYCARVTRAQVLHAIREGAATPAAIAAATGACTRGRCRETNPRGR